MILTPMREEERGSVKENCERRNEGRGKGIWTRVWVMFIDKRPWSGRAPLASKKMVATTITISTTRCSWILAVTLLCPIDLDGHPIVVLSLLMRGRSERGELWGRRGDASMIWRWKKVEGEEGMCRKMNELRKRWVGSHPPSQWACRRKMDFWAK